MTAKEHLQSIYAISQRIKRLNDRREDLRNDLYSYGGIAYDRDRVQTSASGDRMAELVAKVDELDRDMEKEINRLQQQKQKIIAEIEKVPQENYKDLLFDRYVLCQRWEKIALDRDKGIRWIYRLHGKALSAFENIYNSH